MGLEVFGTMTDNFSRALLANHPGVPSDFDRVLPVAAEPVRTAAVPATATYEHGRGVVDLGVGSDSTVNRLLLVPYCDGPPGSQFYVRLYSWRNMATGTIETDVWLPLLVMELLCTAGAIGGPTLNYNGQPVPAGTPTAMQLKPSENLCDDVQVTRGSFGREGYLNTFGAGSGLAAHVYVDVGGPRKVSFDFAPVSDVSMNCFYARC